MTPLTDATRNWLDSPRRVRTTDRLHVELTRDLNSFVLRVRDSDGMLASSAAREFPNRCLQWTRQDSEAGCTLVGATDSSCHIIDATWPLEQIVYEDADTALMMEYFRLRTLQQEQNAAVVAQWKADESVPRHSLEMHPEYPLSDAQQVGLVASLGTDGYALFMEQGCGKTPLTVARVCNEVKRHRKNGETRMFRTIILVPKNLRVNWQREFEKFSTRPGKVTVIRGTAMDRRAQIIESLANTDDDDQYSVVVIGYGAYCTVANLVCAIEWDLAVLDEAHAIKSPKTKRTHECWRLRDAAAMRLLLTGTPVGNTPLDLYAQFEFLGKGVSGFTSWAAFRKFYGTYVRNEDGIEFLVSCDNVPFLQERLARVAFTVTKAEAVKGLPELVYDSEEVALSTEQATVYRKLADELYAEIEQGLDAAEHSGNAHIFVHNALTKLLKLAQVTAGYVVAPEMRNSEGEIEQERTILWFDENPKLDRLIEILKAKGPNDKTTVWASFTPAIQAIMERLEDEGIEAVSYNGQTSDRQRVLNEDRFNNDPTCKVFVGNPSAGGAGLNLLGYNYRDPEDEWLPTNATQSLYFVCDWSSIVRNQSEGRGHRRGTRVEHRITDLVTPQTVDEEIRVRVQGKRNMAMQLRDIRDILKGLL